MELAIPGVALGLFYVVSNQKKIMKKILKIKLSYLIQMFLIVIFLIFMKEIVNNLLNLLN